MFVYYGALSDCVNWCVFLILKALGNFSVSFNIVFRCLAILYPGQFFQLTIGRMGFSCLCSFIVQFIRGALGFKFIYFHTPEDDSIRVKICCDCYRYNKTNVDRIVSILFVVFFLLMLW
jgi:hypothetical protein